MIQLRMDQPDISKILKLAEVAYDEFFPRP